MHKSSVEAMREFRKTFSQEGTVLDVGSQDVNGTYRAIFEGWKYIGLDIVKGKNVDYVPSRPYRWEGLADESFDAVISGQALEHIEYPDKTFKEISRVLKKGGQCCIIAPSAGPAHFNASIKWFKNISLKDMEQLAKDAGLNIKSLSINSNPKWHDCVLIAEKSG
jgi:ubiquinone/menaquinone biosynthesis C-methylase UbiE